MVNGRCKYRKNHNNHQIFFLFFYYKNRTFVYLLQRLPTHEKIYIRLPVLDKRTKARHFRLSSLLYTIASSLFCNRYTYTYHNFFPGTALELSRADR